MTKSTFVTVRCSDGILVALPASHIKSGVWANGMGYASIVGCRTMFEGDVWHTSCVSALAATLPGAFYIK